MNPPRLLLEVGDTLTYQAAMPGKLKSPSLQSSKHKSLMAHMSPWSVLSVCRYGPRLMAPYKPLNLRPLVVVYNLACAGLNLYIFTEILVTSRQINYSWTCQPVDYSSDPASVRIARALWWYYISKLVEMLGK